MSPPSATDAPTAVPVHPKKSEDVRDLNAVLITDETEANADGGISKAGFFPKPKTFEDPHEARKYLKGRLVLAYRIFAKLGFDEGVAGHITLRVRLPPHIPLSFPERSC
jgi:hypothetical protein